MKPPGRFLRLGVALCAFLCLPGGVLWALSPLGVRLSEYRFGTPDTFWRLFPSAPGLLLLGLVGLFFWLGRPRGLARAGFAAATASLLLVLAGVFGVYYTEIDDRFLLSAPAYRTLRLGFFGMALGTGVLAYAGLRGGTLPRWVAAPLLVGSVLGFVSFVRDLSYVGAALWVLYGVSWAWLGLLPPVRGVAGFFRRRAKRRQAHRGPGA